MLFLIGIIMILNGDGSQERYSVKGNNYICLSVEGDVS
jgi:hypothetical protein